MAVTEADRLFMHEGLRECMTEKVADLLMEHLPPTGWADVARVQDLENLQGIMNEKFEMMNVQFSHIDGRLNRMFQALLTFAGITATGFGIVISVLLMRH